MKTLIAYATKHGTTERLAKLLADKLNGEITIHDFKSKKGINLTEYDAVIVGGSIHVGEIQKVVRDFAQSNHDALSKKHLGLFLCCMDKEKAQFQFEKAFPQSLRDVALANGLFGGEFLFDKMNFFERWATKKIAKVNSSKSEIDHEAVNRFAERFNLLPR